MRRHGGEVRDGEFAVVFAGMAGWNREIAGGPHADRLVRFERDPANPASNRERVLPRPARASVWLPPLNYYLPVAFTPHAHPPRPPSRYRQWLKMTAQLSRGDDGARPRTGEVIDTAAQASRPT